MERWETEKRREEKGREEKKRRRKKRRRKKEEESEERRYRWAKCYDSRETLCFANDLWQVVVVRSTRQIQNVKSTPWWKHICRDRCRKSARRCGAKRISKSKYWKHGGSVRFWRCGCKNFLHAIVARSRFPGQNVKNTRDSKHVWKAR